MNLFTQLHPDWHATAPESLLDAPATALQAVDAQRAQVLAEELGVRTLREMANHPLVHWVWHTYSAFRAGMQRELPDDAAEHITAAWQNRGCGDWLASPLTSLSALTEAQATRLGDELGWYTVRHMAADGAFAAAREVHRVVTGGPESPEHSPQRPLKNYFAGSAARHIQRARDAAGVTRPPPPPPAPPAAAPNAQSAPPSAPPMPAATASGAGGPWQAPPPHPHKDYTKDGVYVPRGGGSRGWLDNTGVARIEQPNAYGYRAAVDATHFKSAGLAEAVRVNNRGAERKEVRMQVRWQQDAQAVATPGLCLNISLTGAKLRVGNKFPQGMPLAVTWVHRDDITGLEHTLFHLTAKVVWSASVDPNFRVPRFDCGVEFDPMDLAAQERLAMLLTDRLDELVQQPPPPEENLAL